MSCLYHSKDTVHYLSFYLIEVPMHRIHRCAISEAKPSRKLIVQVRVDSVISLSSL